LTGNYHSLLAGHQPAVADFHLLRRRVGHGDETIGGLLLGGDLHRDGLARPRALDLYLDRLADVFGQHVGGRPEAAPHFDSFGRLMTAIMSSVVKPLPRL